MRELIINFYPLIVVLTLFFLIALLGYRRDQKLSSGKSVLQNVGDDIPVSNVSISELEKSIDTL